MRSKPRDHENRNLVDHIDAMLATESHTEYIYHGSYYSLFTSKELISRHDKQTCLLHQKKDQQANPKHPQATHVGCMNWTACMFCQDTSVKERLISVTTFNKGNAIMEASKYDPVILVRLSGMSDLLATEEKYQIMKQLGWVSR